MENNIIITDVVCDEIIKRFKLKKYSQTKMNIAEVMTTAIISTIQYS